MEFDSRTGWTSSHRGVSVFHWAEIGDTLANPSKTTTATLGLRMPYEEGLFMLSNSADKLEDPKGLRFFMPQTSVWGSGPPLCASQDNCSSFLHHPNPTSSPKRSAEEEGISKGLEVSHVNEQHS